LTPPLPSLSPLQNPFDSTLLINPFPPICIVLL
jgi:hypothetical protein